MWGDQVNYAITASSSIELEHCAIKSSSKVNLLVESYCVGRSITPPFTSYMPMEGILATTPYPYEDWQQSYFFLHVHLEICMFMLIQTVIMLLLLLLLV
jgi:hypothetical protein